MSNAVILGADEIAAGRPFSNPEHTSRDADVMRAMLRHERRRARQWLSEGNGVGSGHVQRETDSEGHRVLMVVPDTKRLGDATDTTVVGFFGHPREHVDHVVLFQYEDELVRRMADYGAIGLLSYYDVELVKGAFGNLILFWTPDVPEQWYTDAVHRRAVEISPSHYLEIRLHRGRIPGALLGDGDIWIERTRYLDFGSGETWHAVRHFDAP
ncbi:MAG TPA: hypothetical protein VEH52_07280 [Gaiellaceae bacterium]|jgi:hypothetical protein|nr:hypothetical protein [Gaiellaceae bacterium]